jgi:glucosyl-3-phosphoglycerate synthase
MRTERARRWHESRTFHHNQFPPERLAAERTRSVSACVPTQNEESTIGAIVADLAGLREAGVLDEVVVVDAGSSDRTAELAAAAGADVRQESELMPDYGPVLGKGDAMWRSLSVLEGDVVVFVDADSEGFGPHFACGLVGPILCGPPGIEFVKGFYRRPFKLGDVSLPEGGGRVTELAARPLLNLFYPELAGFRQPLAGEFAATRDLLSRLPFATGYAVEIAMLIDAWREVGLDALGQVDIEVRQNRHQPLGDLTPMAYAVLRAVCSRLAGEGRLEALGEANELLLPIGGEPQAQQVQLVERPPFASLRDRTGAGRPGQRE